MRRVLVVAIVAIALVSCGADNAASSTAEGKKYVDALMTSYRSGRAKDALTEPEARCIVEHAIDSAGTDAIKKAGLSPKDLDHGSAFQTLGTKLSGPTAKKVARSIADAKCLNPGEAVLRAIGNDPAFAKIPKAKGRCLFLTLGAPAAADRAFADSLLGLPSGDQEYKETFQNRATALKAAMRCKVDPALLK